MEKKQNVKQTTIEDQIELLWNENPRIPFMQSKEILSYGYKRGIASVVNKISDGIDECTKETIKQSNESKDKGSFIGNTKEVLEYSQKEIEKRKSFVKTVDNKTKELDIEEARFKVLDELLNYIIDHRDLVDTYTKIKEMRNSSKNKLNLLKNKSNK